mgnify:CR=1 FL=1
MSAVKAWLEERDQALADIQDLIARQETDPVAIETFDAEIQALLDRLYEIDNPKETK